MIVDAHCHLWQRDMIPEKYWRSLAAIIAQIAPGSPIEEILSSNLMQQSIDAPASRLIGEMETAGIDRSVVFGVDWGLALGEPKMPIKEYSKWIADAAKDYPDKLIAFFTIDPRRKNAAELFEQALTKWEMKGLKLHPTTGYLPDGEDCYKLYKIADQYQVPVITHIGYTIGLKGHTAQLRYFDSPTTDFPDLKFSLAHFNNGNVDELITMMFMKPNTYCDICAHGQTTMMNSPVDFYRQLRFVMNHGGEANRVMFGSDWPITNAARPLKNWVETIQDLAAPKVTDILDKLGYKKFKNKEINQILGANAQKFFNL